MRRKSTTRDAKFFRESIRVRTIAIALTCSSGFVVPSAAADLPVDGDVIQTDPAATPSTTESRLSFEEGATGLPDSQFFWQTDAGNWIWEYGAPTPVTAMQLGDDHSLRLWDTGGLETIILDPDTPSITIDGIEVVTESSGTGLFVQRNGSGSSDSLLMQGVFNSSATNIPTQSNGTRLMWFAERGAFRAGTVNGNHWDLSNIGDHSTAFGLDSIASGTNSAALSTGNASGENSLAAGTGSNATATNSAAFSGGLTYGVNSVAFGNSSLTGPFASSSFAASGGQALGDRSLAMGAFSEANGLESVAIGAYSISDGNFSASLAGGQALGESSTAIGFGPVTTNFSAVAMGGFNEDRHTHQDAATVWQADSEHAVLEVGIGTDENSRKNALTVLQDGSVEIGKATATDNSIPLKILSDGTIIMSKKQGDIKMGPYGLAGD